MFSDECQDVAKDVEIQPHCAATDCSVPLVSSSQSCRTFSFAHTVLSSRCLSRGDINLDTLELTECIRLTVNNDRGKETRRETVA